MTTARRLFFALWPGPEALIAATAAHHGLTVVTRDRNQFDKARVPVINPWD